MKLVTHWVEDMAIDVGAEDYRVKCADSEDRRIKERTDCSSHEQPAGWEDKDSTSSTEGACHQS